MGGYTCAFSEFGCVWFSGAWRLLGENAEGAWSRAVLLLDFCRILRWWWMRG